MGLRPQNPRRHSGPRRRPRLAGAGGHALGRPTAPPRTRGPFDRRVGRSHARRADQPPRRRRDCLACAASEEQVAQERRRTPRRHPRPLVSRRSRDLHVGGARRRRRAVRGRVCCICPSAGRARQDRGGGRIQTSKSHAQRVGVAAPRSARSHEQAAFPHRGGEPAHCRRPSRPRLRQAHAHGRVEAGQGRRRPRRRGRSLRRPRRAARDHVEDRSRRAHRSPRRQRSGKVDASGPRRGFDCADVGQSQTRKDREDRHPRPAILRPRGDRRGSGEAGARAIQDFLHGGREGDDPCPASRAPGFFPRLPFLACVRAFWRAEAAPSAASRSLVGAERAHPRRAFERRRHRHARGHGRRPRFMAWNAYRRLPRPLPR